MSSRSLQPKTSKREFVLILQPVADALDLARYLENIVDLQAVSPKDFEKSDHNGRMDSMLATLDRAFGCLTTGLAFIHGQQVRHKDIKPHNILIHYSLVYYTDLGLRLTVRCSDAIQIRGCLRQSRGGSGPGVSNTDDIIVKCGT